MDALEIGMIIIGALTAIIGYFLKVVHGDVRTNTLETGKNKGKIEQLGIQLENEKKIREIELKFQQENTQKAIEQMAKNISELSKDVRMLIKDGIDGK